MLGSLKTSGLVYLNFLLKMYEIQIETET